MGWLLLVGRGARNVLGSQICQKQIPFGNDNQKGESKYQKGESKYQKGESKYQKGESKYGEMIIKLAQAKIKR
jgi:hypothetical protein